MKILIADCSTLTQNNDLDITVFQEYGDVVYNPNISHDDLLATAHEYDIILCNKTIIDREVIKKAKKLKYIGLFATGYNNIDIDFATKHGITSEYSVGQEVKFTFEPSSAVFVDME